MAFITALTTGSSFLQRTRTQRQVTLHTCARPSCGRRGTKTYTVPRCASIEQQVSQKIKDAMRAKDADALKALRAIRAAFLTALKAEGAADKLSDKDAVAALRKLAKMRNESIDMFTQGGRQDLADGEKAELDVIEQWLPTLATPDQTTVWAKDAIEKTGATKPGDMGKVMGYVFFFFYVFFFLLFIKCFMLGN